MIIIAGIIIGALVGAFNARKRGGAGADIAQYAGVGALIGGLLGVFATIGIERML